MAFTTRGFFVLSREGFGDISRHNIDTEAYESAERHARQHGEGRYTITPPIKIYDISFPACEVPDPPEEPDPPVDPEPDPPVGDGPTVTLSLNPPSIPQGGYTTISWATDGNDAIASSNPPYSAWQGPKQLNWSQSLAPSVTTVLTLTSTNASGTTVKSITLTVEGTQDPPEEPEDPNDPPVELPAPGDPRIYPPLGFDSPLRNFGETALRNWNFGGHNMGPLFTADYGNWEINETTSEPWLFDRASMAYTMWKRTNDPWWEIEWNNLFEFYHTHIDAQGIFTPKGRNDTKYSYVTPFVLYEQETGDTQYRPIAKRIYDAWVREWPVNIPTNTTRMWTEREIAFALEATIGWYEISGDQGAMDRAQGLVDQWDLFCGDDGAPLHTLAQHSAAFDDPWQHRRMTCPWMAGLYFQALSRFYELTGSEQALLQVSKYCEFLEVYGYVNGRAVHPELTGVTLVYYLVGKDFFDHEGTMINYYARETPGWDDMDHALDIGGILEFGRHARVTLGLPVDDIEIRIDQMRTASERCFERWTRTEPTLPKYRLTPPRKFNWWVRGDLLQNIYR